MLYFSSACLSCFSRQPVALVPGATGLFLFFPLLVQLQQCGGYIKFPAPGGGLFFQRPVYQLIEKTVVGQRVEIAAAVAVRHADAALMFAAGRR